MRKHKITSVVAMGTQILRQYCSSGKLAAALSDVYQWTYGVGNYGSKSVRHKK